jgi:hypothetical protein
VDSVRSRQWEDDDGILGKLGATVRAAGQVPDSVRAAARAAFASRMAGPETLLAAVGYDSLLDDDVRLRGGEATGPRILSFQADEHCVEIEMTDDGMVGQLIPPAAGDVVMMNVEGIVGETAADSLGCFTLPRPAPGPVRFRCQMGESAVITDWVRL